MAGSRSISMSPCSRARTWSTRSRSISTISSMCCTFRATCFDQRSVWLEIVQDRRARIDRDAGRDRRIGTVEGAMPAAGNRRHHIALVGFKIGQPLDLVAELAFHDEPELVDVDMEMALVAVRRHRHAL